MDELAQDPALSSVQTHVADHALRLRDPAHSPIASGAAVVPDVAPIRESSRRSSIYGLIACQGDSLTFGSRDPDGMSYPLYLGRLLSHKHRQTWATVNLGVPGDGWPAAHRAGPGHAC